MIWLQRDPLGQLAGPDEYAYVMGEPRDYYDPMGLERTQPGMDNSDVYDMLRPVSGDPDTNMGATPEQTRFMEEAARQADRDFEQAGKVGRGLASMIPVIGELDDLYTAMDSTESRRTRLLAGGSLLVGVLVPLAPNYSSFRGAERVADAINDTTDAAKDAEKVTDAAKAGDKAADAADAAKAAKAAEEAKDAAKAGKAPTTGKGCPDAALALQKANKQTAEQIAGGHAYQKHVVKQNEYPGMTQRQFADHVEFVLNNATDSKKLSGGRTAHWDNASGTVVILDPKSPDGGTAFRPAKGKAYYDGLK